MIYTFGIESLITMWTGTVLFILIMIHFIRADSAKNHFDLRIFTDWPGLEYVRFQLIVTTITCIICPTLVTLISNDIILRSIMNTSALFINTETTDHLHLYSPFFRSALESLLAIKAVRKALIVSPGINARLATKLFERETSDNRLTPTAPQKSMKTAPKRKVITNAYISF